ncbi:hypothetical protein CN068_35365, partial [Sinorhizobium meliloti]
MPSAHNKSPTERTRKARSNWYVGRGARHSSTVGINGIGLTRSATPERQGGQIFSRSPNCERMGRLFFSP